MPTNDNLDRRVEKLGGHFCKPDAITAEQYRAASERIRLRAHATLRQALGLSSVVVESEAGGAEADTALMQAWREQEGITPPDADRLRADLLQGIYGYTERNSS